MRAAANLVLLGELRLSAAARKISTVEVKDGHKVMLTKNGDFVLLGGKFPRATKRHAGERLNEVLGMVRSF